MTAAAGRPLRVGRIDFANCTPLFLALEQEGVRGVKYLSGVPSELNAKLRAGELDLSPSSSVEYLRDPHRYGFLPDLSISSIGRVASVLLFSNFPLEELTGKTVALTAVSATSTVLVRILLERMCGVEPRYVESDGAADAALRIGDPALREAREGRWPWAFDLGALWFRWTATPFVFALWICRQQTFQEQPQAVRAFYRALVRARQLAYRSYPEYARISPQASWMGEEGLRDYWQTISYDLTAWHLEGLRRFAREAQGLDLLGCTPPLEPLAVEGVG